MTRGTGNSGVTVVNRCYANYRRISRSVIKAAKEYVVRHMKGNPKRTAYRHSLSSQPTAWPELLHDAATRAYKPDGEAAMTARLTAAWTALHRSRRSQDMVLTNPPFGKKSSITIINEEGEESKEALTYVRDDFWATTSNKQLNFLQHVKSCLKIHGRAAIVVPDNVLFEGGAVPSTQRQRLGGKAAVADLWRKSCPIQPRE